jgi:hypothetical protein
MEEIKLAPGTSINIAAHLLRFHAPAFGIFNDIRLEAADGSADPQTIVDGYNVELEARANAYAKSPEGQCAAAERSAEVAEKQAIVDRHIERLPWLDCLNPRLVLYWLGGLAEAADDADVKYDRKFVVETFETRGWKPGVNCEADFNENDARNYAGYIVGQWLECGNPMVLGFIERWCAKFDDA